ncbi:MAG: hypothetical protein ACQEWV_26595 [Bacillota bacterium]
MCPCMMLKDMDSSMVAIMALSFGLALGLATLVGTFYLIWRFIQAIEKRDAKLNED